jgi:hypothetical protein
MAEAAEMIGVTERTSRWCRVRYDTEGVEGGDRRLGRASARAAPVDDATSDVWPKFRFPHASQ